MDQRAYRTEMQISSNSRDILLIMCAVDHKVADLIDEVLTDWCANGEMGKGRMFSLYVVSQEIQRRGAAKGIAVPRHGIPGNPAQLCDAVERAVDVYLGSGRYTSTVMDLNATILVRVYHPTGTSITGYNPCQKVASPEENAPIAPEILRR
jgi:hypothetical protein